MPMEMPKGLPFSVDTWTAASRRKRYHFLTHAHRDHLTGIASNSSYPIYATRFTKSLTLRHFPQLEDSLFVEIEVGKSVVIDDPDGTFSVTAFDANHCPGAAMFLFEGEFGSILHTGDCRLTTDCLQHLPIKYISKKGRETLCHLDYLFLDCTFGRCSLKFPSKQAAIQQVINCIWKHPHAPFVFLACDLLGQEEILVEISKTFGSKIFVDKTNNSDCFHSLFHVAPEVLSQDASSRFQVVGFPGLHERASEKFAQARAALQPEPLFIRPSAQWYAGNDWLDMTQKQKPSLVEAERDEFGVWHVCYSMHSSQEELEWALQLLQPKWVISTTPPCRAMELDYVKNHCFKTHLTPDDPLWRLFKVPPGKSTSLPPFTTKEVLKNGIVSTSAIEVSSTADCKQLELKDLKTDHLELKLNSSPPSRAQPVTLFGRARLGIQDPDIFNEKESACTKANEEEEIFSKQQIVVVEQTSSLQNIAVAMQRSSPWNDTAAKEVSSMIKDSIAELGIENSGDADGKRDMSWIGSSRTKSNAEPSIEKLEEADVKRDMSIIGSSKSLNASLRKLYRSMNVPVPRPLPSLIELMQTSKRVKICSDSSNKRMNYC
ncbi:5' exonuclease Apollo [Cocos nucifera]|uniref:5' exonuclease Apollo n=1 Tax=Cocos nucifera TaxID=13894 RepID=A0A8K0HWW8_COCNU|nr:5' exonuclease Apollo [Cocos nucifera]